MATKWPLVTLEAKIGSAVNNVQHSTAYSKLLGPVLPGCIVAVEESQSSTDLSIASSTSQTCEGMFLLETMQLTYTPPERRELSNKATLSPLQFPTPGSSKTPFTTSTNSFSHIVSVGTSKNGRPLTFISSSTPYTRPSASMTTEAESPTTSSSGATQITSPLSPSTPSTPLPSPSSPTAAAAAATAPSRHHGLSRTSTIGIALGVGFGVIIVAGLISVLTILSRRRKRMQRVKKSPHKSTDHPQTPPSVEHNLHQEPSTLAVPARSYIEPVENPGMVHELDPDASPVYTRRPMTWLRSLERPTNTIPTSVTTDGPITSATGFVIDHRSNVDDPFV